MLNRVAGSNMPGMQGPGQHLQQQDYQNQQQPNQPYQQQQQNQGYQQQPPNQGYQQQPQQPFQQQQQQQQPGQLFGQPNQPGMQGPQGTSKPMRGIPTVLPTAQSKPNPVQGQQQQQQQQQQQSTGPNLMQKFTEMAGASAGGDILSKGKELIFMKFGLGK